MMIETENLGKRFGDLVALEGVSLNVNQGEIVGLLGVNGAGKTTLLRILTGYIPATSGKARVAGHDVFRDSLSVRRKVGYLPESVPLYPELRVDEYLRFRARLKGVPRAKQVSEIERVVEHCRLKDRLRQIIGTLSRGYRQRVGLADALLGPPDLLILDEPTSGLDPLQRLEVRELLRELRNRYTVLLSTHILPEVEASCGRVVILHAGRLTPESEISRHRSNRRILIAASGPSGEIAEALRRLPDVEDLQAIAGGAKTADAENGTRWEITAVPGRDPLDDVVALFADKRSVGWRLREMRRLTLSLEETFSRIAARDEGGVA
jgi:ABC-2 type transport system ATP-binding protein